MAQDEKTGRGVRLDTSSQVGQVTKQQLSPQQEQQQQQQSKQQKGNMSKMDVPLDYSFMKIITPADILSEKPRGAKDLKKNEKYDARLIKLNNNNLQDVVDLKIVISEVVQLPDCLTLIDLSFNQLTTIDSVLCDFPHLQILYLHGNHINNISEIDKLSHIKSLRKLALHGNNLEKTQNYRAQVLSRIAQLTSLDMSRVTKADRENCARLCRVKAKRSTGPQLSS